jgi:hypothetical protein
MKTINIFIVTLTLMPCFMAAQDWLPVRSGEKYNYSWADEAIINTTVWADSIHINPGDSIYYLNRVFKFLDAWGEKITRNNPTFLQRELHITDDNFIFYSPGTYIIPKEISIGENWVFNTANNISATLSQVTADMILGQPDSVRVILLTENADSIPDTLKISKSHGIIKFPDFNTSGVYYSLVGLETEGLGMQMPMINDFYDFQVGDSFEYQKNYIMQDCYGHIYENTVSNFSISGIQVNDSTMSYTKNGLWKMEGEYLNTGNYQYYTEYGIINEEINIDFNAYSWMNLYTGQLTDQGNFGYYHKLIYLDISPKFSKLRKKQGYNTYCCNGDTIHISNFGWGGEDIYESREVCAGLGQVYYYYRKDYPPEGCQDFDNIVEELKAYRKGDETYGTFSNKCDLLDPTIVAEMKIPMNDTIIAQNDTLVITLPDYFDSYNWSNGSDSNAIIITSAEYNPGTYQFTVEIGYYGCYRLDAINITILCDLLHPTILAEMEILMNDTIITKNDTLIINLPDYFDSYNWSNGSDSNAIIIASAEYDPGSYQFTVEIGYHGCFLSDTINVTILCDLLDPTIVAEMEILMNDTIITKNDTLIITLPDYFDSYNWSNGSDSNAIIIASAGYDPGTYQFTVEIGYHGCFLSDTINVTIKDNNGVPDFEKESSVAIEYNIPGIIIIVNKSEKELDYCLQLVDQFGRLIKEEYYYNLSPHSKATHYFSDLPGGVYIVKVRTDKDVVTKKIF